MKVKTKDFRVALAKVSHLATRRTTLPALNCVRLQTVFDTLQVIATDLECFASVKCACEGELAAVLVSPKLLSGLVSGEEITLSVNDNGSLKVCGQGSAMLGTVPADEFPDWPSSGGAKALGVNCSDLAEAIEHVVWATDASQIARPMCAVVNVQCSAKAIVTESFNGTTASYFNRPSIAADCEILLPSENIKTVLEVLREKDAVVSIGKNHLHINSPGFSTCVRLAEGQYFNTEKVRNSKRSLIGMVDSKTLRGHLSTILSLGLHNAFDSQTHLNLTGKTLEINFKGKVNSYNAEMPLKSKVIRDLVVDASKLKILLDNTGGDEFKASVTEAGALVFESGDVTNFLQLMYLK